MNNEQRIEKALSIADRAGGVDGAHHKAWVIDQMVRALTGCPMVSRSAMDASGKSYDYVTQGESDQYKEFVERRQHEDYDWDIGIAP